MRPITSVRDAEIAGEITRRLARDGRLGSNNVVQVRVEEGTVQLFGPVDGAEQKEVARQIAAAVPGVLSVEDRLVVRMPVRGADAALRGKAEAALLSEHDPELNVLGVDVRDGIAHIFGQVRSPDHEQRAIAIVGLVPGIKQVVSEVWVGDVRPGEQTIIADEAVLLGRALEAISDAGITIFNNETTASHDIIHLRGQVFSARDAQEAERLALAIDGVQSVKNELVAMEETPSRSLNEELAARVLAEIGRQPHATPVYVKAICYGGDTYLTGQVDTPEQARETVSAARRVPGVTRVFDNIQVRDRMSQPSDDKGPFRKGKGGRR